MDKKRHPLQGLMDHINNPNTRELPFSEAVKAEIAAYTEERRRNRAPADKPPWVVLADEPMGSMAWKMGDGEDYISAFDAWALALDDEAFETLVTRYPEPEGWSGFWEMLAQRR
jgi:hypothetical protein